MAANGASRIAVSGAEAPARAERIDQQLQHPAGTAASLAALAADPQRQASRQPHQLHELLHQHRAGVAGQARVCGIEGDCRSPVGGQCVARSPRANLLPRGEGPQSLEIAAKTALANVLPTSTLGPKLGWR